jgi:hypothetical protein
LTWMAIAEAIASMGGRKRDFGLANVGSEIVLLTAEDILLWVRGAIQAGLVDLESPVLESLERTAFRTRIAFVGAESTSGEAFALFYPKDTAGRMKPGALVITTTGDDTGKPLGVVFRPDVR